MELENIKTLKVRYTRNAIVSEQFIGEEGKQWWVDFADKWTDVTSIEFVEDFTELKKAKILKANNECNKKILSGFESDCLGELKNFDCEQHDQSSIQGLALTAILGLQGLTTEETHWKATEELECYKFEYPQILKLATDMKKHIETCVNIFNAERIEILNE